MVWSGYERTNIRKGDRKMTDEKQLTEQEEQEMMKFIAEFMLRFRERFGEGLRITVRPINKKRRWVK